MTIYVGYAQTPLAIVEARPSRSPDVAMERARRLRIKGEPIAVCVRRADVPRPDVQHRIHRTHAEAGLCSGDPEALKILKQQSAIRMGFACCRSDAARARVQRALT